MPEFTAVVSCPVSEPAPEPKPRLEFAEVMPPEPAPTLEVMSERSACASAPTAPDRFLVSSGFRSMMSRRSASSSFTWFSCFCAFSCARSRRSTGGRTMASFGSIFGFSCGFGAGRRRCRRLRRLRHHAGEPLGHFLGDGVLRPRQQREQDAEDRQHDEQHPQDLAETLRRLQVPVPGQVVFAVIGGEQHVSLHRLVAGCDRLLLLNHGERDACRSPRPCRSP